MNAKLMKNLFLALVSIVFLSSCFEILEEVDLNTDGSGTLSYTLNLSQSKTRIKSALLLDSVNGFKIPDEQQIRDKIEEAVSVLKKAEGLSGVKVVQDYEDYIFTFKCDFTNVDALNNATKYLNDNYRVNNADFTAKNHFSFDSDSNTFKRKGDYGSKANSEEIDSEYLSALNSAKFTSIYRFNQEVESVSNSDAKISPNKKAVMLKYKAMEVATGKKSIENTIQLKK